ncbi:MAG TPA: hypothetical protein PLQ09_01060 [Prolixibacteraceae bacterium]|nr:hypothetical protein [Prolixibacteraceae bacterium]
MEKQNLIAEMLRKGKTYIEIQDTLSVSPVSIAEVKKMMNQESDVPATQSIFQENTLSSDELIDSGQKQTAKSTTENLEILAKLLTEQYEERMLVSRCMKAFIDVKRNEWSYIELKNLMDKLNELSKDIYHFKDRSYPYFYFEVGCMIAQMSIEIAMFFQKKFKSLTGNRPEHTSEAIDFIFSHFDTTSIVEFTMQDQFYEKIDEYLENERFLSGRLI